MTSEASAAMVSYRGLFAIRGFTALYAAHIVSMLGDVVAAVALTVLVYDRTGSPLLSAITFSLVFVPQLIGLVVLPRMIGRIDSRRTLVLCHVGSAALVAVMAIPGIPVVVLLVLLTALGLVAPVFTGMRAALLPEILPDHDHLLLGRSLMRVVSQGAQVVGNLCGAALLLLLPPSGALALDAATFLVSALLIGRTGPRRAETEPPTGPRPSFRAAWRIRPLRRLLLLSWAIPACVVAPEALAAPYAEGIGASAGAVGLILAAIPAGDVVAQVLGGRFVSPGVRGRILLPCAVCACVPLIGFLFRPRLVVAVALLLVCGLSSLVLVSIDHLITRLVDGSLLATVFALQAPAMMCAQGIAFAVWGALGEIVTTPVVIAMAGVLGLLAVVTCTSWRSHHTIA